MKRELVVQAQTEKKKIFPIAVSPNGALLATGSTKAARILDLHTGREVAILPHQDDLVALPFSPEGSRLLTGSLDSTARVFDVGSWREVARLTHGASWNRWCSARTGPSLATGSASIARVFETRSAREISRLPLVRLCVTSTSYPRTLPEGCDRRQTFRRQPGPPPPF
jgi:WD40 repeat protein